MSAPVHHLDSASVESVRSAVLAQLPAARADLEDLCRIPSVSSAAFDQAMVDASAAWVAEQATQVGLQDVQILRSNRPDGSPGAPAVVGHRPAPAGRPTVMLYAHHDVQPPGDPALWTSPAFEPTERNGRLYGRGTADDKAGVLVHLAALRALLPTWADDEGVGIVFFVEGEEEIGSPSFTAFLSDYRERLNCDVVVVTDSDNWTPDNPSLTTTLRGLVDCTVTVETLTHASHSGMFGGPVPDAMLALVRTLNGIWDAEGNVAAPGLVSFEAAELPYDEQTLRKDVGMLDGVQRLGSGSLLSMRWTKPSVTVVGIDYPSLEQRSNTLHPKARAALSLRVAPGQDPQEAFEALAAHIKSCAPFGAHVSVEVGETGSGFQGSTQGPVFELAEWAISTAWGGTPVTHQGVGGSIPFIAALGEVFPEATVLVTGIEDPDTRAHGIDESLHLGVFERACVAEGLLLQALSGHRQD